MKIWNLQVTDKITASLILEYEAKVESVPKEIITEFEKAVT